MGLDPDPSLLPPESAPEGDLREIAERAAVAVYEECARLIEEAGGSCVAVKPQLACFERLGRHGWWALDEVCRAARRAGLLVVADGKRGDVPVTAAAYGQALVGETETPWGPVPGLGADAFTANPLLGDDAVEVLIEAADEASAGVFLLVRTSNPGAARLQDANISAASSASRPGAAVDRPFHEELAAMVAEGAPRLAGDSGLSGVGAVVGATAPQHLGRLRELMPDSVFLIPGVGAQGGKPEDLGPALADGRPASILVAASRSIARADEPAAAADQLREAVWSLGG
jgi:orotidine-5'-phosphate decarboxylase